MGRRSISIDDPEFPHGVTGTGYRKGCRCLPCRKRKGEINGDHARRIGRIKSTTLYVPRFEATLAGHGTRASYQRGCKSVEGCPNADYPCIQANRDYARSAWQLKASGVRMHDPWIDAAMEM